MSTYTLILHVVIIVLIIFLVFKIKQIIKLKNKVYYMYWLEEVLLELEPGLSVRVYYSISDEKKDEESVAFSHQRILEESFRLSNYGKDGFRDSHLREHLNSLGFKNVRFLKK